jgi:hypothetical protein
MATRRSSSNRSSENSENFDSSENSESPKSPKSPKSPTTTPKSLKKQPKGYIWISDGNILTKTTPHELGHGATKTVYLSEYSSGFGFEINEIPEKEDEFKPNKYAIAEIKPKKTPSFTDDEMNSIYDELKLQMEFANDGKATKVLGLLLELPDGTSFVAYTQEGILHELTLTPNPSVCYILMERCGFVTSNYSRSYGQTKSIWKINPRDPRVVVQQVIDCINHIVDIKKMIFYDFKELNVCLSPEDQVIALDFDRHFCKYLREVNWRYYDIRPATQVEVAKGYMFLLFSCEYYKHIHNPKQEIVDALYEGIQQLKIDTYLEQICRFSEMGRKNLLHYLIHRDDKDKSIPSLVQYIEVNYLEQMKPKPKPKPKRGKATKLGGTITITKKTKRRMNRRTKKHY